jgi:hypothetical protein
MVRLAGRRQTGIVELHLLRAGEGAVGLEQRHGHAHLASVRQLLALAL